MKFTEGAFKEWGYQVAKDEFGDITVTETELYDNYDGKLPAGKILIKDRIADAMFQQMVLDPFNRMLDAIGIGQLNLDGSIQLEMSLF